MVRYVRRVLVAVLLGWGASVQAQDFETCLTQALINASDEQTVAQLKARCDSTRDGVKLPERIIKEQVTEDSEFVITPHRQNYVLPFSHNANPNQSPWREQDVFPEVDRPVQHKEAKLQLSLKVPLWHRDLFFDNDGLYFGFTFKSFWQVYHNAVSKPFRETNYRPEVFYQTPLPFSPWDGAFFTRVGIEHESNGRSQLLSRSWNRIYVGVGFLRERWAIYLQPWYRIEEDAKVDDGDPNTPLPADGDDNPDIDRYLGHFELNAIYNAEDDFEYSSMIRHNFASGKGALELGVSFPLWGRLKGYLQYFDGYGESLIDYDHRVQRIGIGLLLTDWL